MPLDVTGSQTVGPFYRIGMAPMYLTELASPEVPGERVTVRGRVLDGDGTPVPDAILEIWQANADGQFSEPQHAQTMLQAGGFSGFGRVPTDDNGAFQFTTIKPGRVPGPGDMLQAPHLVVLVYMRGLLRHLVTRLYFPDDPANDADPILALVPPERRATLIARKAEAGDGTLEWDLHMQGPEETVFFDA